MGHEGPRAIRPFRGQARHWPLLCSPLNGLKSTRLGPADCTPHPPPPSRRVRGSSPAGQPTCSTLPAGRPPSSPVAWRRSRGPVPLSACAAAPPPLHRRIRGQEGGADQGGKGGDMHAIQPPRGARARWTGPGILTQDAWTWHAAELWPARPRPLRSGSPVVCTRCTNGFPPPLPTRTVLPRAQSAPGQLEKRGAQLQQQHVRVAVRVHQEHRVHRPPHAFLGVPAGAWRGGAHASTVQHRFIVRGREEGALFPPPPPPLKRRHVASCPG